MYLCVSFMYVPFFPQGYRVHTVPFKDKTRSGFEMKAPSWLLLFEGILFSHVSQET